MVRLVRDLAAGAVDRHRAPRVIDEQFLAGEVTLAHRALQPLRGNIPGSARATPARDPRAVRRRSTHGLRAFAAIVAGSIACSPPDTRAPYA